MTISVAYSEERGLEWWGLGRRANATHPTRPPQLCGSGVPTGWPRSRAPRPINTSCTWMDLLAVLWEFQLGYRWGNVGLHGLGSDGGRRRRVAALPSQAGYEASEVGS